MTVIVDEARWPWRGRHWAHLCSDHSLAELHAFAGSIGVRRVSFQGDHYDIDAGKRAEALAAGAVPVAARELVRRVKGAGLLARSVRAEYRWHTVVATEAPTADLGELGNTLAEALGAVLPAPRLRALLAAMKATLAPAGNHVGGCHPVAVRALARPGEVALVISRSLDGRAAVAAAVADLVDEVHHSVDGGAAVTELFVRRA